MNAIRTRFAPSPTGYMHIGGMRTALFNWLYARRHQGTFILRIDDTDQARNVESALGPILQAFRWLELGWDEGPEVGGDFGPYFQSQRNELYTAACQKLVEQRLAFYDFTPPERAKAEREAAEKEKRNYINNRDDLELSSADVQSKIDAGENYVIRFVVPRETGEKIVIDDEVRGRVEFDPTTMPDPVIMRGNGTPLYNFATVVDDAAMQISHVIRAEEHLSNTPVQALLFDALGYTRPTFAHIPYVAAPGTKEKMSKRKLEQYRKNPKFKMLFQHGDFIFPLLGLKQELGLDPVMVEYYEKIGYLPDAVFNALARIGWSLDDQSEIMSRETIINNFSLDRVVKSPAGFDPDKLLSFQSHWMNEVPLSEKASRCLPYLTAADYMSEREDVVGKDYVEKVITAVGDRLVLFSDILKYDEFFTADSELTYDDKAFKKRVLKNEDAIRLLRDLAEALKTSSASTAEEFDKFVHDWVEQNEIQIGQIIHALRVAVTGKGSGVGMFDAMAILGCERCVDRINRCIHQAANSDSQS
ncbi:glutamate--tRNA ligase [Rubinisphaera margarita]|uniref:glutamate--tRNA ligase n=1 Tax=Rubinisphaera margarita TaxID=2909586 RepID=UPI001EE9ADCD|nr:glutamate--tRNA ligase [Rubinisphaera margarita]MCG6154410.1 glutamate--tRNA ligase [Rubinisphaera margarita]